MKTIQEEQTSILIALAKYCNDGYSGYSEIAEKTTNNELKTIFNRLSQQRKLFAEELNSEILALGGERIESGSTEGNLHHLWLNIKALFTSNDLQGLIEAAKTGEEFIEERYAENITNEKLPSFLREKLIKQHSLIVGAYSQLTEFEAEV
jgi:uncharacterized protein (TIGR02284 family)